MVDNSREQFIALYLDGAHAVAAYAIVSIGSANFAQVHPREIFQRAFLVGATALAVAHNHPSNNCHPSAEDASVTKRLVDASVLLGTNLLDHVVVADNSFFSFREERHDLWQGPNASSRLAVSTPKPKRVKTLGE
jgi:DNA repair protein RadC